MNTNTKLNKISPSIAMAAALLVASTQVTAEVSKESVLATAMDTCKTAAINKYGEKAIKSVESRVKWNKGLNGAEVKMKIRKKSTFAQTVLMYRRIRWLVSVLYSLA